MSLQLKVTNCEATSFKVGFNEELGDAYTIDIENHDSLSTNFKSKNKFRKGGENSYLVRSKDGIISDGEHKFNLQTVGDKDYYGVFLNYFSLTVLSRLIDSLRS
jgi:hypothetical protein